MTKQLFIQTHGCQMNEYDSSSMANLLTANGLMTITKDPASADILLLNTCSIRERAEDKVFSELGVWREFKLKNPSVIIGVGGCVASQEGAAILKRAPFVDLIFGPQTLHRLPAMLQERLATQKPVIDISFPEIEKFDRLPDAKADGPTAFVSIMEGCSKYCSFCVVPYTRGTEISRPLDDVLAEIAGLASQNVKEITLLGQNVNDYAGPMHSGATADLADLINLMAQIDGIERIRYTTSHPLAFSDNLIQAYKDVPKLANHLHLPVQSGSNRILNLMKRGYTAEDYLAKINKLKQVRPNISITSDFIIGFPGETDADFAATMDLIAAVGFDHSYSFLYSKRPGTPAALLNDTVPIEVKKERLAILQNRIQQNTQAISTAMIDTVEPILVHAYSRNAQEDLAGRTENNRVINFKADASYIGRIVPVKIVASRVTTLRGELVSDDR